MAFNAKNLQYEKQEPAFLRRLRGVQDAADGRNNVQIARPKKSRLKTGDGEEDEPVIVDEHGQAIGKTEFEAMQKREGEGEAELKADLDDLAKNRPSLPGDVEEDSTAEKMPHDRQQVAGLGNARKRKPVRMIGGDSETTEHNTDDHDGGEVGNDGDAKAAPATTRGQQIDYAEAVKGAHDKSGNEEITQQATKNKIKRRAKKIKLSFDDLE